MRKIQATLIALLLGAVTVGCNGPASEMESVATSEARLVMAVHGSDAATLHVSASDDETDEIVIDRVVDLKAGGASVLDVDLAPTSYTFHVDVLGEGGASLGSASRQAALDVGVVTEIRLTADVDPKGAASVEIGVDDAPKIDRVTVDLGGAGNATVAIHVEATDPDGDALTYFWSGVGIDGAVKGTATMTIPAAEIDGDGAVHIVVQDARGAITEADVTLVISGSEAHGTIASGASGACLEAQASCNAKCDASFGVVDVLAKMACVTDCSLALASCHAP